MFPNSIQGGPCGGLRYVIFDLWISSQSLLEYIRKYQSRLRDFTNVNLKYAVGFWPLEHLTADLVARAVNATLITSDHPCYQPEELFQEYFRI